MAKCKYCHQDITRLDKEVCPFCGGYKPLEGEDGSTQDITKVIGDIQGAEEIKLHSRVVAAILAFVLGVFGAHLFYIGKVKKGLITLACSLVFIFGLGSLIFFFAWPTLLVYVLFYLVIEALMIGVGIGYLVKRNITDSNGAFLK